MEKHVIVLGGGFGGLTFCQTLEASAVRVTLVDRSNHHLFQPLLYQVATAGLSAPEVAEPIRSILARKRQVTVLMDEVKAVDLARRKVTLGKGTLEYDYLVMALGGITSYFGHPEWEKFAPGLKTLEDALRIRREVLLAFEQAETELDPERRRRLMTILVVGGGPTGVELAGAFAELARHVLRRDFRRIDPTQATVTLIEGGPVILPQMPSDLSRSAQTQLENIGVHVRTSALVQNIQEGCLELRNGERLFAQNIIWAAGVGASPLTQTLGVDLDRAGRVKVLPDLSVPSHPEAFVVGDMALVAGKDGRPVPGVSPAAMQMARHVARLIELELQGMRFEKQPRPAFRYWDKGTMATIGRSAAVAMAGPLRMHGLIAWLAWLAVHLIFLIGFRNKAAVLLQWAYSYFAYKRGARIIVGGASAR